MAIHMQGAHGKSGQFLAGNRCRFRLAYASNIFCFIIWKVSTCTVAAFRGISDEKILDSSREKCLALRYLILYITKRQAINE